jgi:membrane-bound ClpP family serine protease
MRDGGTHHHAGLSPLAGVSAGTAAVLFAFGVLALAWHRVAAQVSTGITVLVYVFIAALAVVFGAFTWFVVLWVRHRHRHPELLAGRQVVRAEVAEVVPQAVSAAPLPAIGPPRVYLNVTEDQLAAIMRHHTEEE